MAQTIQTIKTHAATIKNETQDGANTALRVGGTILELAEYVETLGTGGGSGSGMTDAERAQLNKASAFITRLAQNGWVSLRNYFEQKDGKLVYHPYRFLINADGSIAAQAMEGSALPTATQAQDGLLSAADKKRLDSLVAGTTYDPRVTNMIAGLYDDVYGTGEYIRTPVTNIVAMPSADMQNYKIIYNQARIMEDGTVETSLVETSIGAADGISAGVVSAADYNRFWDASEHLKSLIAGLNWDLYGTGQTILRPVVDMTSYLGSDGIGIRYNRLQIAADGTCQLEAFKDIVLPNCDGITSGALSVSDWQKIQNSDTKINNLISGLHEDVYGTGQYLRMPVTWLSADPQTDGESWKIQFNRAKIAADGTVETTLESTTINSADNIQAGLMSVADWTYLNALRNYVSSDGIFNIKKLLLNVNSENWNVIRNGREIELLRTFANIDGAPSSYFSGISITTDYVGFQLVSYGGGGEDLKFRKIDGDGIWHDWYNLINEYNLSQYTITKKDGGTIQKWLKILSSGVTTDDGAGCRIEATKFWFLANTADKSTYTIAMEYESGTITCGALIQNSDMREKNVIEDKELTLAEIADAPLFSYTSRRLPDAPMSVGTSAQYWDGARPSEFTTLDERQMFALDYGKLATAMGISLARHLRDYEQRTDKRLEALEQRLQAIEA